MSERVALLSDVHGNSCALRAVLQDVQRTGCTRLLHLGDLTAGMDPQGCADLLRSCGLPLTCIQGNAELYLFTPDLDELPDREDPEHAGLIQLMHWTQAHLTPDILQWLQCQPTCVIEDGICLAHDSPLDRLFPERWHDPGRDEKYQEWYFHARGIFPDTPEAEWEALYRWMDAAGIQQVYCGHTHEPFCKQLDGKRVCTVGSAGFSLDSDPRVSWVLLEDWPDPRSPLSFRRVAYDIAQYLQKIDKTPDYPTLQDPAKRAAYKKMFTTGVHWRWHLNQE
jgi:predicted phosphodiesterase